VAKFETFEDMEVWKLASRLCVDVYQATRGEAFEEDWSLRNQIRKSAVSIPSNIAEGFERRSDKEFARFLVIAKGSAGELRTQLHLARSLGYLEQELFNQLLDKARHVSSQIANLVAHLRRSDAQESGAPDV
jgi:four helix bundle protein